MYIFYLKYADIEYAMKVGCNLLKIWKTSMLLNVHIEFLNEICYLRMCRKYTYSVHLCELCYFIMIMHEFSMIMCDFINELCDFFERMCEKRKP